MSIKGHKSRSTGYVYNQLYSTPHALWLPGPALEQTRHYPRFRPCYRSGASFSMISVCSTRVICPFYEKDHLSHTYDRFPTTLYYEHWSVTWPVDRVCFILIISFELSWLLKSSFGLCQNNFPPVNVRPEIRFGTAVVTRPAYLGQK